MIKFPFSTFQQFNLDWIMEQLHKILQFMPLNGSAGDVLQRTVDGAAWQPISAVSLDIHGLNSTTPDAADEIAVYDNDLQGNYKVTVQDVLDMVSSPVTSVNGQTGAVVLDASDVNALPDSTTIPSSTSDLVNDSGFVDAAGAAAAAPVQSVNGMTGNVIVSGGGGAVDSVNGRTGAVIVADNRVFSAATAAYYTVTADITVTTSSISIYVSQDGKYVRMSGYLKITTGDNSGWKRVYYYKNSSQEKIDFVHPSQNIERVGVGLEFDAAGVAVFADLPVNFTVTQNGDVYLSYYQRATEPTQTERNILIPSCEICTAL